MDSLADRLSRIVVVGNDDDIAAVSEAATYFRQHATALEIGRGIGREEAAKEMDEAAARETDADDVIVKHFAIDMAALIRAASPALDVEGMVAVASRALAESHVEPRPNNATKVSTWLTVSDIDRAARAVVASLGIKNG